MLLVSDGQHVGWVLGTDAISVQRSPIRHSIFSFFLFPFFSSSWFLKLLKHKTEVVSCAMMFRTVGTF